MKLEWCKCKKMRAGYSLYHLPARNGEVLGVCADCFYPCRANWERWLEFCENCFKEYSNPWAETCNNIACIEAWDEDEVRAQGGWSWAVRSVKEHLDYLKVLTPSLSVV